MNGVMEHDSVLSKAYSANSDTLIYEIQISIEQESSGGTQLWRSRSTVKYADLDSQVVPGVHIDHTSRTDTTGKSSRIDSMWIDQDFKNRISNSEYTQDANHFEPSSKLVTYTAGLGVSSTATGSAEGNSSRQLYYYKKGSESVGISRFTGISEEADIDQSLHVYPNPISCGQSIYLSGVPESSTQLSIYDLQGRLLSRQQLAPTGRGILCAPLNNDYSPGVYMLQLTAADGRLLIDKLFITP